MQHSNFDRVMESRDHLENGASSKNQMDKENFLKRHILEKLKKTRSYEFFPA
jgi:hypothetical protein